MTTKQPKENGVGLTPANMRFLAICFKYMKSVPDIDFEGVAAENPFKSAGVARTRFGQVRRIIREALGDGDHATQDDGTPKKRKGDSQDSAGTPQKRTKKGVKKETTKGSDEDITPDELRENGHKNVFKKEKDEDSDDGDMMADSIKVEA